VYKLQVSVYKLHGSVYKSHGSVYNLQGSLCNSQASMHNSRGSVFYILSFFQSVWAFSANLCTPFTMIPIFVHTHVTRLFGFFERLIDTLVTCLYTWMSHSRVSLCLVRDMSHVWHDSFTWLVRVNCMFVSVRRMWRMHLHTPTLCMYKLESACLRPKKKRLVDTCCVFICR